MMVTQLQNQDPMEPTKNEQLLTQMSQIGQLQSQQQLTQTQGELSASMKSMVLQNSIGAASNLIGKDVEGAVTDEDGKTSKVAGNVEGITIKDGTVLLKLDTGATLAMDKVTSVQEPVASTSDLANAIRNSAGAIGE